MWTSRIYPGIAYGIELLRETMAVKFMQSLDHAIYRELERIAKDRGISMQELIRAVVIPDWINMHNGHGQARVLGKSREN